MKKIFFYFVILILLESLIYGLAPVVPGGMQSAHRYFIYRLVVENSSTLHRAYTERGVFDALKQLKFYGEIGVSDYHAVDSEVNSLYCLFTFSSGRIVVDAVETRGYYLVNLTLMLDNFTLLCPQSSKPVESVLAGMAGWDSISRTPTGDLYHARRLALSRLIRVNPTDNNATDAATGEPLGEWLVWLSPGDMAANATLLLVGRIADIAYTPPGAARSYGLANLVLLNTSWTAGRGYTVNGTYVDRARTVAAYAVVSVAAGQRYVNLSDPGIVDMARRFAASSRCLSFTDYGNGSYGVSERCVGPTYRAVAGHKPWRLGVERTGLLCSRGGCVEGLLYYVEYGGKWFLHPPLDPYMLVYDRVTGILLEQGYSAVPYYMGHSIDEFQGYAVSLLSDYFALGDGLHLRLVFANKKPVGLVLEETNMHIGEEVIRGRSQAPWDAYALYVMAALVVAAAVLVAVVRRK